MFKNIKCNGEKMLKKGNLKFKLVDVEDAKFILKLRTDGRLNEFLSQTKPNIEEQKEWIEKYKSREREKIEYYYIIEYNNVKYGTLRIYNINNKVATWGSWIISPERPKGLADLSAYESFKICFEKLDLEKLVLDVLKNNKKAIYLYEKYGFKKYKEDEEYFYYYLTKENYENKLKF